MKIIFACALLFSLAACDKLSTQCATYKDEATCVADTACHWNKNENLCKS